MSAIRDYLHRPAGEAVPSEAPRVFGVEMRATGYVLLAEQWVHHFGSLEVALARYRDGQFSPAMGAWEAGIGSEWEGRFHEREDALSAIEAELTRIESEIRAAREGKK